MYYGGTFYSNRDLYFSITFATGGGANNAPPLLPLSGCLALGIFLLGSGAYMLRRRRS